MEVSYYVMGLRITRDLISSEVLYCFYCMSYIRFFYLVPFQVQVVLPSTQEIQNLSKHPLNHVQIKTT